MPRVLKIAGVAAAVFLVAAVSHMTALGNGYVLDDFKVIVFNDFIARWDNIKILLDPQYIFTPYPMRCGARPMTVLSLLIDYRLWLLNPFGYHLTSILCHGCNASLVFLLAVLLLDRLKDARFGVAVLAGFLYALHPVQAEAVDIVSFRADLLVTFFYMLALILFIAGQAAKRYAAVTLYIVAFASFVFALFSKEMALTLPLVVLLFFAFFKHRTSPWKILLIGAFLGLIAAYFFLSFWRARFDYLLYSSIFPNIQGNISPASSLAAYVNTLSSSFLHYVTTLFYPVHLSIDYLVRSGATLLLPQCIAVLALLIVLGWVVYRSDDKLLKFGIGMFFLSYLPVSNLVPLINTVNDRYMYLPMAGFSLAMSAAVYRLPELRFGSILSVRLLVIAAILAFCGWLTLQRNFVFEDGYSLYGHASKYVPDNLRVRYNLGVAYMTRKKYREAIEEFENVARLNPFFKRDDSWYLTGVCHEKLGDNGQAKQYYSRALRLSAKAEVFDTYAELLLREGDIDGAIHLLETGVNLHPDAGRYNNLGVYYVKKDALKQAIECFRKAVDLEPVFLGGWENLLHVCGSTGDKKLQAREIFRMITQLSREGAYIQRKLNGRNVADGALLLMAPGE